MWHREPHALADDAIMQPLPASSDHDGCTPDHCTQTDVPMIARTHTPRTCPAVATR